MSTGTVLQSETPEADRPQGGKFVGNGVPSKTYQPKVGYKNVQPNQNSNRKKIFADYISIEDAEKGIKDGVMFRSILRINPKNFQECFLDNPKGTDYPDVLCLGPDRNRAMQGDDVTVRIKPKEEWLINTEEYTNWWKESGFLKKQKTADEKENKKQTPNPNNQNTQKRTLKNEIDENGVTLENVPDKCLITTGSVVRINKCNHNRVAAGKLQLMPNNIYNVLFVSTDSRIPRIMIPRCEVDKEFFERPNDFARFLYTARITGWRAESIYADGQLVKLLGDSGNIEVETERIIYEQQIDDTEFSDECLESLPITSAEQWSIPPTEFDYRRDFRDELVFTIDPKTARDLDDALSIIHIDDCDGEGTPGFEVGVHIADVAYFVADGTELDRWAKKRGNSTYLAQKVIPMLPRILCEQLCSLNPGVDRLSFSAVFKLTYEAEIKNVWFGRSIIRSRVKLAYEHAQDFIENPEKDFGEHEIPEISDGNKVYEIKEKVLMLHRLAQVLRKGRESNGALRIEQPKLKFTVDPVTKEPMGVSVYEIKDSNKLVEEYMLLTNMEVAKHIEANFPQTALLRNHPPPKQMMLKEVIEQCARIGFPIDGSSSRSLSSSFQKYQGNSLLDACIRQVISSLTIKPMQTASYFCVASEESKTGYRHYALNVDYYTHFTSPIRRYPDLIVHRQLAASLGYCSHPNATSDDIQSIAIDCNQTKLASKTASEKSSEIYFGAFIHSIGKIQSKAVVVGVMDKAFDVLVVNYGVTKRVYCDKIEANAGVFNKDLETLILEWPQSDKAESGNKDAFSVKIQVASVVDVELYPLKDIEYGAIVLRPNLQQRKYAEETLKTLADNGSTLFD